jgi:hypothetical protein
MAQCNGHKQSGPKKGQNQIHPIVLKVVLSTKFYPIHGLLTHVNVKDSDRKIKRMSRSLRGTCAYGYRTSVSPLLRAAGQ